jgi:hypothetical protein
MMEMMGRTFNTQFKQHEDNTPTGRTNLRVALDANFEALESAGVIYNHDISKLTIEAGVGPKDVEATYTRLQIPGVMTSLDFKITLTW